MKEAVREATRLNGFAVVRANSEACYFGEVLGCFRELRRSLRELLFALGVELQRPKLPP